jgi:hypothetical protein
LKKRQNSQKSSDQCYFLIFAVDSFELDCKILPHVWPRAKLNKQRQALTTLLYKINVTLLELQKAGIAQLVEHNLAKVGVASSNLVSRSKILAGWQSGYAADCKSVDLGSTPGPASILRSNHPCRMR